MFETNEIDLTKRLELASPDLAARIKRLENIVDPLLDRVYSIFPAYTHHDVSHSKQVMTILGWLLPPEMANSLSAQEIFCLLAAALLHDIGMLEAVDKVGDQKAQKQIRDSHHLRSEHYVKENYERLGLDKPEADAISEICRSHRKINIIEDISDIPDTRGKPIRMQLLCASIRIADELHLTADRAPKIVLDAVHPPQDSISHFEKHLSIDGVGPLDSTQGSIQINATVQTLAAEKVLHQMVKEIQEKLTEVEPIFTQHNLPWKTVELKLQRRKVVERKVTLYLARFGKSSKDELVKELDESLASIDTCLQDLTQWHHIEFGEKPNNVCPVADSRTFEHLLKQFLKTEEEILFMSSPYLRRCLEDFAFEDICQQFDAIYDLQERTDRILVLQSSPTALYLLLFVSEFECEPAIIPRRSNLDGALLFGFLTDVFRFPQIAQIRGIAAAITAIQHKIGQDSKQLLNLFHALGPDCGREWQDVFNDLVSPPDLKKTNSEDSIDFKITVSHPRIALKRGLTFPHLLKAATISGEKLELVGNKVKLSSEDPRMSQAISFSPNYLTIRPHPLPPISGMMFCRVEIDHSRKRITLFVDGERSADYSRYPLTVRMTMSRDGANNATFNPTVYTPNTDVKQVLQIDEMLRWFKSGEFHRFVVELDQPELLPAGVNPSVLESLGPDIKNKNVEPLFDDRPRQILQHLTQLQNKIEQRIPSPINLTPQQEEAIVEFAKSLNDMNIAQIHDELLSIAEQSKNNWTTIRISTYFPNGQVESDEFLGPFSRITPNIKLQQDEKNQEVAEMLRKGEVAFRITQNFTFDMATLRQKIIQGFTRSELRTFLPEEPDLEAIAQTACQIDIRPIQDKMWYREQVIHYHIRDVSAVNNIYFNTSRLQEEGQIQAAIKELTDGLHKFPKESILAGLLGWAYYKAGDLESAYKYSLEATNPQDEKWSAPVEFAYYNLGLCALLLDRIEEAVSWYEQAVTYTGPVLDEAIEDLEAISAKEMPEVFYVLAFLYEHKQDLPKAIELYKEYLHSNSQYDRYKNSAQSAIKRLHRT